MRLILNGRSNNPDLELIDASVLLNNEFSTASWGMYGSQDASGNGYDLGNSPTFDAEGLITTVDKPVSTGLMEGDEMTFVIGHNLPRAGTDVGNVLSNLVPAVSPFKGLRVVINNGVASIAVGTGTAATANLQIGTVVGGWTVYAFSVNATKLEALRMNGTPYSLDLPARAKSDQPFFISGAPDGSQVTAGYAGHCGVLAVYNKFYPASEQMPLIDNARAVLGSKGIPGF